METVWMGRPPWEQRLYACMHGQPAPSKWIRLGLLPLWGAAQGYRGVVAVRYAAYISGVWRRRRLPCRVISVGNLTFGGTGKTPLTIWLAQWFQRHGWRVAVLSRGYKAQAAGPLQVVSRGDGSLLDWRAAGDEAYLLARALPGVPVLIGKDRYRSGRYACERFGVQVVILDDGFQYLALHRDLNVVLLDATNPFGHGTLLPRGILREPVQALRRADAIVMTRVESATGTLSALCQHIRRWATHQPLHAMTTVPETLYHVITGTAAGLAWLRQRRVMAFAGIGNPPAFAATLTQLGADVVVLCAFPDHHAYTAHDWHTIVAVAQQQQVSCLITTEKDAIRLSPDWPAPLPVYALRIGVRLSQENPSLAQQLQALMG
jgi:tetraacyldisaccharide 4'-kinase